jgi:hypothetical protein
VTTVAAAEAVIASSSGTLPLFDVPVEDVGLAADVLVEADPVAFQSLFSALMRRAAVQLDYVAKSGRLSMTFSPHSLVRSSFRLHFRGFGQTTDGRPGIYIDIVPDRVLRADWLGGGSYVGASGDADWHKKVRIVASLRDDVPGTIAAALRQEHGMIDGYLQTKPVRAAVAIYVAEAFEARRVHGWEGPIWQTTVTY